MKKRKIYIRLIVLYSVIFAIPLVLNLIMLDESNKKERNKIKDNIYLELENTMSYLENQFLVLDALVENLTENQEIRQVAQWKNEDKKYKNISQIKTIYSSMKALEVSTFVEEGYLFFGDINLAISSKRIFIEADLVDLFFQYNDMSWENWMCKLKESYGYVIFPEAMTLNGIGKEQCILYVQPLAIENRIRGNFVFMIPSEMIRSNLANINIGEGGGVFLLDKDNQVLVTIQSTEIENFSLEQYERGVTFQEIRVDGEKKELILVESKERNLVLAAVLPYNYLDEQIYLVQKKNMLMLFLVLLVGGLGILLVSWHKGKVIESMMEIILYSDNTKKEMYKGSEMSYISNFLKEQVSKNKRLENQIKEQKPLIRRLFLENLVHGNIFEMEYIAEFCEVQFPKGQGIVLVYQVEMQQRDLKNIGSCLVYKKSFTERLQTALPGHKYYCDTDIQECALICEAEIFSEKEREQLLKDLQSLCDLFLLEYGVEIRVAVGTAYRTMKQIGKSYELAREMLRYGVMKENKVLDGEDYYKTAEHYFFPGFMEENLINRVKSGNVDSVRALLNELYEINISKLKLSPQMIWFWINDVQCAVVKTLNEVDIQSEDKDEFIQRLSKQADEKDVLIRIRMINQELLQLCECVRNSTAGSKNNNLKNEIKEYILGNYSDTELCLKKMADNFGYESVYFSKLFKELFHENFAASLERIRIEKICELLKEGDTLECIANQCGYNTVAVMRVAFKRVKGMTPKEYRDIYCMKKQKRLQD